MKWKEGGQFEQPPAGSHIARCYALIDLGSQPHKNKVTGEQWIQRDVRLCFELPTERMLGCYDEKVKGKPFGVMTTTKQSLHPQAGLRKLLEGWRGKKFDATSIEQFEPKNLVGLSCRLNLVENGNYINIQSVSKLGRGEVCPPCVNPEVFFSLEEGEFDPQLLETLPQKTRELIKSSPEYEKLTGASTDEGSQPDAEIDNQHAADDSPF